MSILSKLQSLLTAANATTGESDTTLTDAMQTLVDGYGQGGGSDVYKAILNNTATGALTLDISFLKQYALSYLSNVTSIKLTGLTPNTTDLRGNLYDGGYCISNNTNLETLVITSVVRVGTSTIRNNTKLKAVDISAYLFGGSSLQSNTEMDTLILRQDYVPSLANINCFNGTPFASDGTGGTLYVPSALISNYQSVTNWSTILGYANNSIQAIEGSQYENYYADGTPIT